MSVISYQLLQEMIPDDILDMIDELHVKMTKQDWHGMQLTLMRNGKFTIDVQMVVDDNAPEGR